MKFRVVAEKSHGLFYGEHHIENPLSIRNILNPELSSHVERRTWNAIEARDEKDLRRLFDEAVRRLPGMAGFVIVKIERVANQAPAEPATPHEESE